MNSKQYWAEREAEQLKHYITDEKEYDKQIERIYTKTLDNVQKEINAFYGKYAAEEGITLAEAKKRVSKLDIAAYERKAKQYVKDKDFSDKANEEMRLYNLTMKVNRLEMLKANIGLELISGTEELNKYMEGILQGRTIEELQRQAGILGKTIKNNAAKAHAIVNGSFHNATFSDRIWLYQDILRNDLSGLLQSGLIQGKNPRQLARDVKKKFDTTTYNAERLMRTELARVQTEAQKQSFERNGFTMYEFIVNGGCCDICAALSGKHFKVAKMMPGENAPPMHPHCRCSTAAWEDSADYNAWLDYLDKGGTTKDWEAAKQKRLTNSVNGGIIASGAIKGALNNKNDPEGLKRQAHAEQYYLSMRNSEKNDIISAISKNSNIDRKRVAKMFEHLIINKYELDEGFTNFAPDYDIAESIRRLREGKNIQEHDKILVQHEAFESDLMNEKGLSYEEAHNLANKKYNYQEALDKWLDKQES